MFLCRRGQFPRGDSQFPPEVALTLEPQCAGRVSPSNFVKIFGFAVVHGALDATEASVLIIEQDGWYFESPDRTVVQEPGPYN